MNSVLIATTAGTRSAISAGQVLDPVAVLSLVVVALGRNQAEGGGKPVARRPGEKSLTRLLQHGVGDADQHQIGRGSRVLSPRRALEGLADACGPRGAFISTNTRTARGCWPQTV